MQEIQTFFISGMYFVIDLATLLLVMASIAILVYAVATMVRNRQPRWDNLLFIPAALFLFAVGLQVLPPLFMKSARIGLADSNAEAVLLREELRGWLPEVAPVGPGDDAPVQAGNPAEATPAALLPTATPELPIAVTIIADGKPETAGPAAAAVRVKATPMPPTPTVTPLPVCMGARENWAMGCILPTPEMGN